MNFDRIARVVRWSDWWHSKMPPLFAIAYLQALHGGFDPQAFPILLFVSLIVTGMAVGSFGHFVNDIFDLELDRQAGRQPILDRWHPIARLSTCFVLLTIAFLPFSLGFYGSTAASLLVLEVALPALYAIPPIRLKERGALGIWADAMGAHVVPTLFVVSVFSQPHAPGLALVVLLTLWSASVGVKGILYHQMCDRDDDLGNGLSTFATRRSASDLQALITDFAYPVELASFSLLVVLVCPQAPLLAGLFGLQLLFDLAKRNVGWHYTHAARPTFVRRHAPLVNSFFYELWFPLALAISLAGIDPRSWWLPLVHLVLFPHNVIVQCADIRRFASFVKHRREQARDLQTGPESSRE